MTIPTFYHPGFEAPIGEKHIMPMRKFALVAEGVRDMPGVTLIEPVAAREADLLRVHTPDYVNAIRTGQVSRPTRAWSSNICKSSDRMSNTPACACPARYSAC